MLDKTNLIIKIIANNIQNERWCARVATTRWEEMQEELRQLFETNENITEELILNTSFGEDTLALAEAQADLEIQKENNRWDRFTRKTTNRAKYLPTINFQAHVRSKVRADSPNPEGSVQWCFSHDLDSNGLMVEILEYEGYNLADPVVMNVENHLPYRMDDNGRETEQYEIPESEVANFWDNGYLYSAGKTIWNIGDSEVGKRVREIFSSSFDYDITFGSYNRRFRAPLVPGGFLPGLNVRTESMFVDGVLQYVDGSGVYDPDHPAMADLMVRYGPVALQITAWSSTNGKLWKGIIIPRVGINNGREPADSHPIVFDHLQVKSDMHKSMHKSMHKLSAEDGREHPVFDSNVHVGVMKSKTSDGKVSSCFELIEQLGPVGPFDSVQDYLDQRNVVLEILNEFVAEAMERIRRLGPEGLLGRATRDDPKLARLADFLRMVNKVLPEEHRVNPLDIPVIKSKIEESLGKTLWPIANGAGIKGKYMMVVIDQTLEPGTVVMPDVPYGKTVAVWRFPTIAAQGLVTAKVVEPREHHMVYDQPIQHCIFMHPHDIVVCQQGDDDGDEVGVSTDQRLVKLFHMKKDRRIYHIEPSGEKRYMLDAQGQKVQIPVWSPEGRQYIAGDPMGPVGRLTIMKAGLDAVGAYDMSRAFAVGCQEAIDSAKNFVRPTDPYRAAKLENWYEDKETGEYHVHVQGETDNWIAGAEPGEFPLDIWEEAYEKTLIAHGCAVTYQDKETGELVTRAGWPLGWRTQRKLMHDAEGNEYFIKLRKSVAFSNWEVCLEKQDGADGNWVHHVHDEARRHWLQFENEWTGESTLPARDLLQRILQAKGLYLQPTPMSWEEYSRTLRESSGLNWYGKEFGKLNAARRKRQKDPGSAPGTNEENEQARVRQIDILRETLDVRLQSLTRQQLFDIWWMELSETWWYHNGSVRVYIDDPAQAPKGVKGPYKVGTANYAFTAVTNSNSPIMDDLGVEMPERCRYLLEINQNMADNIINWCFRGDNPYERLTTIARRDAGHPRHKTDGNGDPIHLGDCPDCMQTLTSMLVRRVRERRKAKEIEGAKRLNSAMNAATQQQVQGWNDQSQIQARADQVHEYELVRDPGDCQEQCM